MSAQSVFRYFHNYCDNSSVHGLRYVTHKKLCWTERAIWIVLVLLAFWGTIVVSLMIKNKFQASLLSTVVETANYPISEIPFPAVTICNNHRLDFRKYDDALQRFLPNASYDSNVTFLSLLRAFEVLDFGSFDEFEELITRDLQELPHLDLKEVATFMAFGCPDLFVRCWWRNKYLPCCEIFTRQFSEYGACYSFNSNSSSESGAVNRTYAWPWRVSSFNEWSALRLEFKVKQSMHFNATRPTGLLFIVHNPYEWPNIARFVPAGSTGAVRIWATTFYVSKEVKNLPVRQRQCINNENSKAIVMKLDGLRYLKANCMSECHQHHMAKFCNCSLALLFYDINGRYPVCNITNLPCLNMFNDYFNYEVPPQKNEFFSDDKDGMLCDCLPECDRIEYKIEVQPDLAMSSRPTDKVTLDFHFGNGEMVRYRTDVSFGWLDLMVSFGGVAGLFLGMSLLSGVEIIYYLTVGLYYQTRRVAMSAKSRLSSRARGESVVSECSGRFWARVHDNAGSNNQWSRKASERERHRRIFNIREPGKDETGEQWIGKENHIKKKVQFPRSNDTINMAKWAYHPSTITERF